MREPRVEQPSSNLQMPTNRTCSAYARLRIRTVNPINGAISELFNLLVLHNHVYSYARSPSFLRSDEQSNDSALQLRLQTTELGHKHGYQRHVAEAVGGTPTVEPVALDGQLEWIYLPFFGVGRHNIKVATNDADGLFRVLAFVRNLDVRPALFVFQKLELQRSSLSDVRFQVCFDVTSTLYFLRNETLRLMILKVPRLAD
mmetsp:Transcript_28999/g.50977  ORF Transcript_28999/g.50977 Transcript_28999/m.50977 type:complete len:201 (+) Transcript_28999:813-1415(+)